MGPRGQGVTHRETKPAGPKQVQKDAAEVVTVPTFPPVPEPKDPPRETKAKGKKAPPQRTPYFSV